MVARAGRSTVAEITPQRLRVEGADDGAGRGAQAQADRAESQRVYQLVATTGEGVTDRGRGWGSGTMTSVASVRNRTSVGEAATIMTLG
jgi:hypothetical protein